MMTTPHQFVYKVAPRAAWDAACRTGTYEGSADDRRDGYIHLSSREQLAGTLAKHFSGQDDLVLIQFETRALGETLRWEVSRGGQLFPHLYAGLPTREAMAVHALHSGKDGIPMLPEDLTTC
jgi:uncharacterized protein (DUF952 family)